MILGLALLVIFSFLAFIQDKKLNFFNRYNLAWVSANVILLPFVLNAFTELTYLVFRKYELINHWFSLSHQAVWVQFICFFVIFDLSKFILHYTFHKNDRLWQFHQVHHAQEEINYLSAYKHTWLEAASNVPIAVALQFIFNVRFDVFFAVNSIFLTVCIWQHSKNKFLDQTPDLIMSPKLHRIHHRNLPESLHGNYGLVLTVWDRLFRTFVSEESVKSHNNLKYGITKDRYPTADFWKEFSYPFSTKVDSTTKSWPISDKAPSVLKV